MPKNDSNPYQPPTDEPEKRLYHVWSRVVATTVLACLTLYILFTVTSPQLRTIHMFPISDWTLRSLRIVSNSLLVMSAISLCFSTLACKRGDWHRVGLLLVLGAATFATGWYLCLANNL